MSTRSHIGIVNGDHTVTVIYCHFDGYPSHHVPILTEAYGSEERVRELLALGDLSCLDRSTGEKHDFDSCPPGVCNAYGRDRGEVSTAARVYRTRKAFEESCCEDYTYLFENGTWIGRNFGGAWHPVVEMLNDDAA